MDFDRITNTNKRTFNASLIREGRTILNYWKNSTEKVLFFRTNNSRTSQDKEVIFYSPESSIAKGDVLYFNNYYYIVLNENYHENDVWRNSVLIKCNSIWQLYGKKIPLVASDLSSTAPTNGTYLSTVGGAISFYTKDVDLLHSSIGLDDVFYDFGGAYKLVNKFFVDGLAYLYFERTDSTTASNLQMYYGSETSYKLKDSYADLIFYVGYTATSVKHLLPCADITYTSSDTSIATIDSSGKLTFIKEGTVTITASSTGRIENGSAVTDANTYNVSTTATITIKGEVNTLTITNTGTKNIQAGGQSKKLTLTETDTSGNNVEFTARPSVTYQFLSADGSTVTLADASEYITDAWTSGLTKNIILIKLKDTTPTANMNNLLRLSITTATGATGTYDFTVKPL